MWLNEQMCVQGTYKMPEDKTQQPAAQGAQDSEHNAEQVTKLQGQLQSIKSLLQQLQQHGEKGMMFLDPHAPEQVSVNPEWLEHLVRHSRQATLAVSAPASLAATHHLICTLHAISADHITGAL